MPLGCLACLCYEAQAGRRLVLAGAFLLLRQGYEPQEHVLVHTRLLCPYTRFHKGIQKGSHAHLGFICGFIDILILICISIGHMLQHTIFLHVCPWGSHMYTWVSTWGHCALTCIQLCTWIPGPHTCTHMSSCGSMEHTHAHTALHVDPGGSHIHTCNSLWAPTRCS